MRWLTAEHVWTDLSSRRSGFIDRCERYAALTIPKVCLPDGVDFSSVDQTHDFQSLGAQAVNHLTNKIMMSMFAPTRPAARITIGKEVKDELSKAGVHENEIAPMLAKAERDAMLEFDRTAQRPKLHKVIRHLIVVGNVLQVLEPSGIRVFGVKNYCVKRDYKGRVHTGVIKECLPFNELDIKVQGVLAGLYSDDAEVSLYRWIKREPNGSYSMSQWVDSHRLPAEYDGKWKEDKLPYRFLTWDLADEEDYASGLVEEYSGDFEAMSMMAEAVVDGAVLGTEMRWLVNPSGMTTADDFNRSKNGDAIPGNAGDVNPVGGGNDKAVSIADTVLTKYERRIGMGFLMQSAVQRQAERVTAEEVRMHATELEMSYGGTYSALGLSIQKPIFEWLLDRIGFKIDGTDIEVTVITGLEALSRNGDLDNLRLAFSDLAQLMQMPPELQARIKFQPLAKFVGDGRGVDITPFIMSDEEYAQQQQAQQQSRVAEASATAAGEAQAQGQA